MQVKSNGHGPLLLGLGISLETGFEQAFFLRRKRVLK